jgi:hypothetical protein
MSKAQITNAELQLLGAAAANAFVNKISMIPHNMRPNVTLST